MSKEASAVLTRDQFIRSHWSQYLICEADFIRLSEYIDLRDENMRCSSNRIAIQLVTVCSLIDSTVREMLGQSGKASTLDLVKLLLKERAFDSNVEVRVLRATGSCSLLKPWAWLSVNDIKRVNVPDWWDAYGNIKHDRHRHFDQGNLSNLLSAQAALYSLELVYAKKIGDYWYENLGYQEDGSTMDVPNDISKAFSADDYVTRDHVFAFEAYAMSHEEIDRLIESL